MPLQKLKTLYKTYEKWVPLTFFLAGFTFDAWILTRIDDWKTIVQQAAYLIISGALISFDLLEEFDVFRPKAWFEKIWHYREAAIHFLLGTLMNGYTIFYFKSASIFTSIIFVALLIVVLTVTEFKKFGIAQRAVHFALLSLCTLSYFIYVVPIALGFVGVVPFIGAIVVSLAVLALPFYFLRKKLGEQAFQLSSQFVVPAALVHLMFIVLYFTQTIPPVPLSLNGSGIYHAVKKENGKYVLTYLEKAHHWWKKGDQTFFARPGDKIYCFVTVFSPTRFKDKIQIRWVFHDPKKGWDRRDAIPLSIAGGREEGYRGYTTKENYEPGDWRVQIETTDNREIGRLYFTVVKDETTGERGMKTEIM